MVTAIATAALIIVVVVLLQLNGEKVRGRLPLGQGQATGSRPRLNTAASASVPSSPTSASFPSATTTGTGVALNPDVPVLTSLDPSTGLPGQMVVVSGEKLTSPSGLIEASVGSKVAPVRCQDPTMCVLTVPYPDPSATRGPVPVTLTTNAGTSAPLTFSYG